MSLGPAYDYCYAALTDPASSFSTIIKLELDSRSLVRQLVLTSSKVKKKLRFLNFWPHQSLFQLSWAEQWIRHSLPHKKSVSKVNRSPARTLAAPSKTIVTIVIIGLGNKKRREWVEFNFIVKPPLDTTSGSYLYSRFAKSKWSTNSECEPRVTPKCACTVRMYQLTKSSNRVFTISIMSACIFWIWIAPITDALQWASLCMFCFRFPWSAICPSARSRT